MEYKVDKRYEMKENDYQNVASVHGPSFVFVVVASLLRIFQKSSALRVDSQGGERAAVTEVMDYGKGLGYRLSRTGSGSHQKEGHEGIID